MPNFTKEEIELLKKYVTDPVGNVFAITNLEGIVGAIYARYSRAKGGFREVLLKEFIKEGMIDAERAADLIDRVLVAYGDDSVGELEGAHLSFENISMIATKEIEDRRIGGSPIEQSTRYVFYDQKDGQDHWRYYRDPKIMASPLAKQYQETMDFIFETYASLVEPLKEYYQKLKTIDEAEYDVLGAGDKQKLADLKTEADQKAFRITYNSDIRTKACDALRCLLPLSTLTNVGIFGNGRFFQNVLTQLYTSPLSEAQEIAEAAHRELNKVIPKYVKRAKRNDYLISCRQKMQVMALNLLSLTPPEEENERVVLMTNGEERIAEEVNTIVFDKNAIRPDQLRTLYQEERDNLTYALMLYEYCRHPLRQLLKIVRQLPPEQKIKIREAYIGDRSSRRDRPYRALESGYPYTFDLITDFGTYKDLERHRMTSQLRQAFSPLLGFTVPDDLAAAGFEEKALQCHDKVLALYQALQVDFPVEAAYATMHGHRVRWVLAFNEREAYHLLELRTTPQGHPQYRKVCQEMHRKIASQNAWRAEQMKFVDYNDYFWSRAESEARQRVKEKELDRLKSDKSTL